MDHRLTDTISDPGHPDQMDTDEAVHPEVHRLAHSGDEAEQ
jgi:hypothetical protein